MYSSHFVGINILIYFMHSCPFQNATLHLGKLSKDVCQNVEFFNIYSFRESALSGAPITCIQLHTVKPRSCLIQPQSHLQAAAQLHWSWFGVNCLAQGQNTDLLKRGGLLPVQSSHPHYPARPGDWTSDSLFLLIARYAKDNEVHSLDHHVNK